MLRLFFSALFRHFDEDKKDVPPEPRRHTKVKPDYLKMEPIAATYSSSMTMSPVPFRLMP